MKNEIILYSPNEQVEHIEVRLENETVWLNRQQMSTLFGRDVKTVGKHISNIFSEGELARISSVANFATVQIEGNRNVERSIEYYNLDVIISVGYRVKSIQGTQFRQWANQVLKDYLLKGYAVSQRIDRVENEMFSLKKEFKDIKLQLKTNLPPNEGIFFNGEIFDAWVLCQNS